MHKIKHALFLLVLISGCTILVSLVGCTKVYTTTAPDGVTVVSDGGSVSANEGSIEYRVSGTATQVLVTYSNGIDGTNQLVTSLPWSITVHTASGASNVFVSLRVDVIAFPWADMHPFMNAQIFGNGNLLTGATVTDFTTPLIITSTFRP